MSGIVIIWKHCFDGTYYHCHAVMYATYVLEECNAQPFN